ncbi:MAG: carbohydrate ABC transporter permease [Thermoproteota archaeon]|jgi:glucose/mannose transport system permease protein
MRLSKDSVLTLLILLSSVILVGYFIYVFIGWNILISFSDWVGLAPRYNFVGFKQYVDLSNDPVFWSSLANNLLLVLLFVPGSLILGLFLAILLDIIGTRGEGIFRTIFLLPFSLSFVITATLWSWMYDPSLGVLNTILGSLGLSFLKSGWITDPKVALYCVILALIWQFSGYTALIFSAGIKSIPETQIMAAKVDGASDFEIYARVILPQLKSWVLASFVILMVFALKAFDFIYVLTNGGPGYSTYVLGLMMFIYTFFATHFSYGAAIATILFTIVMLIVIPYVLKVRHK